MTNGKSSESVAVGTTLRDSRRYDRQEDEISGSIDDDAQVLQEMGYKQDLYRGFSGFMSFAFCYTAVSVFASISVTYSFGIVTGGPAVMIWGWLVASLFTLFCGLAMAEICSTYPSAGSVYHWAGMLAPQGWGPFCSFIAGWFNFIGNAAGDCAFAFGFADVVASAASYGSGYEITIGYEVMIAIGVSLVWTGLNAFRVDQQGWLNNVAAIVQVVSSVMVMVWLLAGAAARDTLNSSEFVWTSIYNGTGYEGDFSYVASVGLLAALFAFSGYEAGAHMAEETKGARRAAPLGIVATCVAGGVGGFMYLLGLLYGTFPDIDTMMANAPGDLNCVDVFISATGQTQGLVITSILIVNLFFAGMSSLTVTSRIAFAMARDGAFPGSHHLTPVNERTKSPLRTVLLVLIFDSVLLLLPLVSTSAFQAIVGVATVGFQISYAIPIFMRVTSGRRAFNKTDFHLGPFSIIIGWLASLWLFGTSVLFFLPAEFPVSVDNMNWTCVVVSVVLGIGLIYWVCFARKFFEGPKRTVHDG